METNLSKQHVKDLIVLALPLFVGILGHTLVGVTDVFVVARYNIKSLAALSIANSIFFSIMILGLGILIAVSIILSNLRGSKQKIKHHLLSTIFLSVVLAIVFAAISYFAKYLIPNLNLEEEIVPYIMEYMSIVAFSMFGIFIYEGIKQFLQSYEIVKFPNLLSLCAVFLNLILDVIFVFGFGPIPSMGSKGAAIASLTVRLLVGLIMLIYVFKFINFKSHIDFDYTQKVIKTGFPIGIALLLECLAFNIVSVFAGMESSTLSAVHAILVTISSVTFMIPLAISTALSVKVAYWYGAGNKEEVKKYSYSAFYMIIGFMVTISLALFVFPNYIISFFTKDSTVINIAVPLLSILAAYQIFDGFQAATGGVLKGFKLTKKVSLTVLAGYWLVGAPIAFIFVTKFDMSLRGYWMALAISLCIIGITQVAMVKSFYKNWVKSLKSKDCSHKLSIKESVKNSVGL